MRPGPTPVESSGNPHFASQLVTLRRCNLSEHCRRIGSLQLASRGDGEALHRCLASRSTTASPDHPLDTSDIPRLLHARAAPDAEAALLDRLLTHPGSDASPTLSTASSAADRTPSSSTLSWREGVADHISVPITSNCEAAGVSAGSGSRIANPSSTLRSGVWGCPNPPNPVVVPGPETQGAPINLSLQVGSNLGQHTGVVNFTACVSRWLEGSSAGLRNWLNTAVQARSAQEIGDNGGSGPMVGSTQTSSDTDSGRLGVSGSSSVSASAAGGACQATAAADVDDSDSGTRLEGRSQQQCGPVGNAYTDNDSTGPRAAGCSVEHDEAAARRQRGSAAGACSETASTDESTASPDDIHDMLYVLEPFSDFDGDVDAHDSSVVSNLVAQSEDTGAASGSGAARAEDNDATGPFYHSEGQAESFHDAALGLSCAASPGSQATAAWGQTMVQSTGMEAAISRMTRAVHDSRDRMSKDLKMGGKSLGPVSGGVHTSRNTIALAPPPLRSRRSAAPTASAVESVLRLQQPQRQANACPSHAIARDTASCIGASSSVGRARYYTSSSSISEHDSLEAVSTTSGYGSRGFGLEMSAAMLNWELSHAADWRRVAVLIHVYSEQLDCIHISAALVRLAKLHRRDPLALTIAAADVAVVAVEPSAPGAHSDRMNFVVNGPRGNPVGSSSRNGSAGRRFARASARSRAAGGGADLNWLAATEKRRVRRTVAEVHPGGCPANLRPQSSNTQPLPVTAIAAVRIPPASPSIGRRVVHPEVIRLLNGLLMRVPGLMPRARCRTVSNMLWALGVLQPLTASQHRKGSGQAAVPIAASTGALLAAKIRYFWQDAEPQALALSLWGLARMGLRPGAVWVAEYEYASARLLPRFNEMELSCSLWALAALRLRPNTLWLDSAQRVLTSTLTAAAATKGTLRSIATLLWALAVLQVRLDGKAVTVIFSAVIWRLRADRAAVRPQALSMSLWGCARLGLRPPTDLLATWRSVASGPLLAAAPARAVAVMLWSLARMRCAPPRSWTDQAVEALLARAREGRLGPQALCMTINSLALLDSRVSPYWLRAFTEATAPLVGRMDSSELGVVLHGLGRIVHSDHGAGGASLASAADVAGAFATAAAAAAADVLQTASADDVAGIGTGLSALGVAPTSRLQYMLVRHMWKLIERDAVGPRHAAACLKYFAVARRCTAGSCTAGVAAGMSGVGGSDASAAGDDDDVGEREPCYDAIHVAVPADTKQPLPPPQPPPSPRIPPPPPRQFFIDLLQVVLTADVNENDVFDVSEAFCAAAELDLVAATPAAQSAIATSANRVCCRAPSARVVLRLLQGMYGLQVKPCAAWLARLAAEVGGRLRLLSCGELELLLRLLAALQAEEVKTIATAPTKSVTAAAASANSRAPQLQRQRTEWDAGKGRMHGGALSSPPSAVTALLRSAHKALAAAPVQHLVELVCALVACSSGPEDRGGAANANDTGWTSAALSAPPVAPAQLLLHLPPGWMRGFEEASTDKLKQPCVSGSDLVELLACFAVLGGHVPGCEWAGAWYDSSARRLRSMQPSYLCMALHLQRRLGLQPPMTWLRSHAAALVVASKVAVCGSSSINSKLTTVLHPLEVLAAVAELQRLGLDDETLVVGPWPGDAAPQPPAASLSSLVAAAATQLHAEMLLAAPTQQLATLATLQAIADPQGVAAAPHAEGWAVGLVAMAHSVIAQRPLHQLLAGLAPQQPLSDWEAEEAIAPPSVSPMPVVVLLASMARWGHCPDHSWLSGIARHICRHAEEPASAADGCGWVSTDVARAVCCLAALGYVPDAAVSERLQKLLQPALAAGELHPALAAELCCAWAAVRRQPPPSWWRAAEAALAAARLAQVPPSTLVRLPFSMVQLGHVPSYEWLTSYTRHLPAALATQSSEPYTAAAGGGDSRSRSTINSSYCATDITNLVWSLGFAVNQGGYMVEVLSDSGALQALLAVTLPLLGSLGPGRLVLLMEGLAWGRHRLPSEWVEAFSTQVTRQLSSCGPLHLISFLVCLACLDAQLSAPWLKRVLRRTSQLLPPLLYSSEAYLADDLEEVVTNLDPTGRVVQPFLTLLARQRAAVASSAPARRRRRRLMGAELDDATFLSTLVAASEASPLPAWLGLCTELGDVSDVAFLSADTTLSADVDSLSRSGRRRMPQMWRQRGSATPAEDVRHVGGDTAATEASLLLCGAERRDVEEVTLSRSATPRSYRRYRVGRKAVVTAGLPKRLKSRGVSAVAALGCT